MSRVLVPAREEDADQVGSYACHLVAASPSQRPLRRRGVLMKRLFIGTVTVAAALAVNPTRAEHLPSLCPGRVVLRVDATDASGGSFYFVVRGRLLIIANQGLTLQAARGRCHGALCVGRRGGGTEIFGANSLEGGFKFRNGAICGFSWTPSSSSYRCWQSSGQLASQGSLELAVMRAPRC